MRPPPAPPSGPRSITQSAVLMTSRLCSMMMQGVAGVAQFEEDVQQFRHIMEMQAGGRLIQNIERVPGGFAAQFRRQLDALRFAAAQRGGRLAQAHVAQAPLRPASGTDHKSSGWRGKMSRPRPPSCRARRRCSCPCNESPVSRGCNAGRRRLRRSHRSGGRKCISILINPSPWHFSQRPPLTLKLNRPRLIAADSRRGQLGEQIADLVEHAGVSGRIAARRAANRRLVNHNDFVERFKSANQPMLAPAVPWNRKICGTAPGAKYRPPACFCPNR